MTAATFSRSQNGSLLSYPHESCDQAEARIVEEHDRVGPSCSRLQYRIKRLDNVQQAGR